MERLAGFYFINKINPWGLGHNFSNHNVQAGHLRVLLPGSYWSSRSGGGLSYWSSRSGGGGSNKPLERLPWVTWRSDLRDEGCEHQTHTAAVCLCGDDRPQQIMQLSFIWTAQSFIKIAINSSAKPGLFFFFQVKSDARNDYQA